MDILKTYGNYIKKYSVTKPSRALWLIETGLHLELFRTKHFASKEMPLAYQKLNTLAVKSTLSSLEDPKTTAWTNLFTPVEILQCFGLNSLSIECLSSFLSGFTCEDFFIDKAEQEGIAPTLCSYHKNFIGAVDSGVIPKASFAVTTSMICDGNINTFRHISEKHNIPSYVIDIPNEYSTDAVNYVVSQLKELIAQLEEMTQKTFDMEELKNVLRRENESRACYQEFLKERKTKYYPTTLTLQMYMLFATHLSIGSKETLEFFQCLKEDIKSYPDFHGKRILWIHLLPFYQASLKQYFNFSKDYQIQAFDMNFDYDCELDVEHPLEALATKMLKNSYNGTFDHKIALIDSLVQQTDANAVINFCHWGCKQSSGGVFHLREYMKQKSIPFLVLDGDGIDRRNSHDGQIKTRIEAFLEVVNNLSDNEGGDMPC